MAAILVYSSGSYVIVGQGYGLSPVWFDIDQFCDIMSISCQWELTGNTSEFLIKFQSFPSMQL